MLHVTNGDVAAARIASLDLPGEVLPWQDVLHDGPVPAELSAEALRRTRADFLAGAFGLMADEVLGQLQRRDARLQRAICSDAVILWFEPDLYDQLQLLQVLDACESVGSRVDLHTVPLDTHFGSAAVQALRDAWESREPISPADGEFASRAWGCFRSDDPGPLEAIPAESPRCLPHVAGAISRLLQEYPSRSRGLARSEAQLLEALAGGAETAAEAFRLCASLEEHVYLGDASFALYVQRLGAGDRPLLRFADGAPLQGADPKGPGGRFWRAPLELTADGRAVCAGQLDRAYVLPFDHWIGGVHLHGHEPAWRRTEEDRLKRVA
jgi:hypothetical protein